MALAWLSAACAMEKGGYDNQRDESIDVRIFARDLLKQWCPLSRPMLVMELGIRLIEELRECMRCPK
jgi:hypothetical protein